MRFKKDQDTIQSNTSKEAQTPASDELVRKVTLRVSEQYTEALNRLAKGSDK